MTPARVFAVRVAWSAAVLAALALLAVAAPVATWAGAGDAAPPRVATGAAPSPRADGVSASTRAADPDTSVENFLHSLADSTDSYFGISGAPIDTTGLDSARAHAFANPMVENLKGTLQPSLSPWLEFNRVDGAVWGGSLGIGRERRAGRVRLHTGWAAGPNQVLGDAAYEKRFGTEESHWIVRARGGRTTNSLDRRRNDSYLTIGRAFLTGNDRTNYLRREGFGLTLVRGTPRYRLSLGWRGARELPLATTTTWNLLRKEIEVRDNLAAARGRAREFEIGARAQVPHSPVAVEVVHQTSSRSAGSDFEYRRTYFATGADVGLGRWLALVPQFAYGRLSGDAIPQEAFYIGGSRTLRSIPGQSLAGTGMAIGRLDLIAVPDLLALARIPHPDMFPIQGSIFIASGAAWGADPRGGPARPGIDWPNQEEWKSEAGLALHYQPGIPDPESYFRFSFAFGLGANHETNFTVTYTRAIDLLRGLDD